MSTKLIVSNEDALRGKYKAQGLKAVRQAVDRMTRADAARGVTTKLLWLDDASALKHPVTDVNDPEQAKKAIDEAFVLKDRPDYLMILGAPDVVTQQDLRNPVPGSAMEGDPDRIVTSDLPYACEARYSRKIKDFIGPTRVVGRLPNVKGDTDPKYLISLIDGSAQHKSRDVEDYDRFFGSTAKVWLQSTKLSLREIFNTSSGLFATPNDGPKYKVGELDALMHFVNCHGAFEDWQFYGQEVEDGPTDSIAHDAAWVGGKIRVGTVAAFECCYGGDLYAVPANGKIGIANVYLQHGAYGVWGSTTIAYGPADSNAEADLICQYFLQAVREGASLGRAALMARQKFIQTAGRLSPTELKTLGQFVLLGDPSVHPVTPPPSDEMLVEHTSVSKQGSSAAQSLEQSQPLSLNAHRDDRRATLAKVGMLLRDVTPVAAEITKGPADERIQALFRRMLGNRAIEGGFATASFEFTQPKAEAALTKTLGKIRRGIPKRVHTAVARLKSPPNPKGSQKTPRLMVMYASELENGEIICRRTFGK